MAFALFLLALGWLAGRQCQLCSESHCSMQTGVRQASHCLAPQKSRVWRKCCCSLWLADMLFTPKMSQPPRKLWAFLHDHHVTLLPALPVASIPVTGSVSGSGDVQTTASNCDVKVRWPVSFIFESIFDLAVALHHPNTPCKGLLAGITLPQCPFTSLSSPPGRPCRTMTCMVAYHAHAACCSCQAQGFAELPHLCGDL